MTVILLDSPQGLCWRIYELLGLMVCCGALVCRDAHPDSTGDER